MRMKTRAAVHGDLLALIAAVLCPPAACAILLPWRSTLPNTNAALALVVVIVAVAATGHRLAGLLAACSAAVWFDFFLTEPYERFTITRHTDLQTTLLLLVVGAAVTELSARARRRRQVAAADEAFLAVVASTSGLVAAGRERTQVIDQVRVQLTAMLALRGVRFELGDSRPRGLRLDEHGTLQWGSTTWNLREHGYPDEPIDLPARHGGRIRGRFVLEPVPGAAPSQEARRVAIVLADLAAAALAHDNADNH
jgi:hypothetical protein